MTKDKCTSCIYGQIKDECNAPNIPQQICKYNYIDEGKAKKEKAKSFFKKIGA